MVDEPECGQPLVKSQWSPPITDFFACVTEDMYQIPIQLNQYVTERVLLAKFLVTITLKFSLR